MKLKAIFLVTFLMALSSISIAGTIRVYNSDSEIHRIELKCSGSSKSVEIRGSTTASYTFHSSSNSCDIVGGTIKFPGKKLENGQKWKIKNGKAMGN